MPTRGLRSSAPQHTKRQAVSPSTLRARSEAARRPGTRADAVTTIDPQSTGAPARAADAEGASLDKVRDLLFGVHMRDADRKFARLEERLGKETAELREEVKKRLAAIEQIIRQEVDSLSDRLKVEQEERAASAKDLSRELRETAQSFDRRASQLDDQISRGLREVRHQLHEQQQQLTDEMRAQSDELLARLTREATELRGDKADRSALAALFTEMAMRLNDEFRLPLGVEDTTRG
jgi:DNA anti-recombination protein RmuC